MQSGQFVVPAGVEVVVEAKSPNAADTDVDVTAYLYDLSPLAPGSIAAATFADNAITASAVSSTAVTKAQAGLAVAATALSTAHWTSARAAKLDKLDASASTRASQASVNALADLGAGAVTVSHSYSATDYLRYATSAGVGIDGATVLAYLTSDYASARTGTAYVKGTTTTDTNGRWSDPLYLDYGTSASSGLGYTFYFNKPGLYGPDTKTALVKV